MSHGYYRLPTLHSDRLVFVSEDDLWAVPTAGGVARRLTANLGAVSAPFFSPDGATLAFTGREEGHAEVYVMETMAGWVNVLPKNLALMPPEDGGFWIPSAEVPKG